jgi:hypothetical protein
MVVAALLAGSITLWLANDVATRELPDNIVRALVKGSFAFDWVKFSGGAY